MRILPFSLRRPLFAALVLTSSLPALAQNAPAPAETPVVSATKPSDAGGLVERITHEDALSRVDELRIGGSTRHIAVKPKSGAPAYEIEPLPAADSATSGSGGSAGRSRWRILTF